MYSTLLLTVIFFFLKSKCTLCYDNGCEDKYDSRSLQSSSSSSLIRTIERNWKAYRSNDPTSIWNVSKLPTTALTVLLENRQIPRLEQMHLDDIYFSNNLQQIPDINIVGPEYYTLIYEYDIPPLLNTSNDDSIIAYFDNDCQNKNSNADKSTALLLKLTRQTLRISGINYRAFAWLDGKPLNEIQINVSNTPGMFRRRYYDVTKGGKFHIQVLPPDHYGVPVPGQGGDHSLAQDGATVQYNLGWDWCQAMPDRATGFYGSVLLETTGSVSILDPAVQTIQISCNDINETYQQHSCQVVKLRFLVSFETLSGDDNHSQYASVSLSVTSDWGETWNFHLKPPFDDFSEVVLVQNVDQVKLWWPHGMGISKEAHLHQFTFSLISYDNDTKQDIRLDEKTVSVGIRTVETFLDKHTQGQRFQINGQDIYLVGGNWIATDQALRYSSSLDRYCTEIMLHKHAGLNLIRIWGGGTAERDELYICADKSGMLVYQEFWMTGDNNGRWAGNYSWPLDHKSYLMNVEDTVRRLRNHPSLLFYGGCNECLAPQNSRWAPNPPSTINDGIRTILDTLDPGRFYIASSMGGQNKADKFSNPGMLFNRSYSLSFSDGPYGMLLPITFFERNPGLPYNNTVKIGFQPEIGSVSSPTYKGLLRFMTKDEVENGFPRFGSTLGSVWEFHKFLPWTTILPNNDTYDHVFAYFSKTNNNNRDENVNASEWAAAAQLAAHVQYQNLFNGFLCHAYEYTTGVIMWKTQSPWPSLRGFLYDWYLEINGALRGVRASLYQPVAVVFDPLSWKLHYVDRRVIQEPQVNKNKIRATATIEDIIIEYDWIDVFGTIIDSERIKFNSSRSIDMKKWPVNCSSVCFFRIQYHPLIVGTQQQHKQTVVTWHWLTNPSLGPASDYSQLGELRKNQSAIVYLEVDNNINNNNTDTNCFSLNNGKEDDDQYCTWSTLWIEINIDINVVSDSPVVLFYPTFSIYAVFSDAEDTIIIPLLPVLDEETTNVIIRQGESQKRTLKVPLFSSLLKAKIQDNNVQPILRVEMESWNCPMITVEVKL